MDGTHAALSGLVCGDAGVWRGGAVLDDRGCEWIAGRRLADAVLPVSGVPHMCYAAHFALRILRQVARQPELRVLRL